MKRREFLLAAGLLAAPLAVRTQPQKVWRIGFLAARSRSTPSNPQISYDAFVQGMRELGYVEGKNLVIEWRFVDGKFDRFPALAAELVGLKPEVIVSDSTGATQALKRATGTIPIVAAGVGDPVASGFAASLARPGGNITGLSVITSDVYPKQLELLKTMLPALSRIAVLVNPDSARGSLTLKSMEAMATKLGVKLLPLEARTVEEIERGFGEMKRLHVDALLVQGEAFLGSQRHLTTALAVKYRLPSIFTFPRDAEAGGLMSYGPNGIEPFRRAANYVDRIFKGAKPGELPIELPRNIHFAINRKTANALGIAVPQELLHRADLVIE